MGKTLEFLEGLVLGAISGAAVAFLLAPQSGSDLTDKLRRRADDVLAAGRRAAAERRAELEAQFAQVKQVRRG